jgi:glycosyltransferase involved in cell wall biosynthesis
MGLCAARKILRQFECRIEQFDIVHVHDPYLAFVVRQRYPKIALVQTVHGTDYEHSLEHFSLDKGLRKFIKTMIGYQRRFLDRVAYYENSGMQGASSLIAVDKNQSDLAIEKGVKASRITQIYNAVDVNELEQRANMTTARQIDCTYFLMLRRFAPKNGVEFGVRAFLSWVGDRDIRLVIAGDGQLREQINSECLAHRCGSKVIFLGEVSPDFIPALIKGSIATLVPSVPVGGVVEATSFAALESLALGVPVIASDIGGLSEIDGGKNILNLVPPASVEHIALEMEKLYWDYQNGAIDRESKRKHVVENFDTKIWGEKVLEVYRKAVALGAPFSKLSNIQRANHVQ